MRDGKSSPCRDCGRPYRGKGGICYRCQKSSRTIGWHGYAHKIDRDPARQERIRLYTERASAGVGLFDS